MLPKAPKCRSRERFKPRAGKIDRAVRGNAAPKSSLATFCCSARGEMAAAAIKVRLTTRTRTRRPTLAPAKLWMRISHSETLGRFLHFLTKGELS
jgi:hypothetical protein